MMDFAQQVAATAPEALYAERLSLLQVNLGLKCNMACAHCHHGGGPGRTEEMDATVFEAVMGLAREARPDLVDLTGGAPELHPRIRDHVRELRQEGLAVQIRTNLTALLEPGCRDLPELWASLGVRLLASLPSYHERGTDLQRGPGAFTRSVEALKALVALGYGPDLPLRLDIASNPPVDQMMDDGGFEAAFRRAMEEICGVAFGDLVLIANVPVGRAACSPGAEEYTRALEAAFNPATLPVLACRSSLAVGWDGTLYDCDFNLAASIPALDGLKIQELRGVPTRRLLAFGRHCFACTAREGSS